MQDSYFAFSGRSIQAAGMLTLALLTCGLAAVSRAADAPAGKPATTPAAAPAIDFSRQIQPILAKHCFQCHGPNDDKGGLRLNSREGALAELESGAHAVVPDHPDESELLERVQSTDADERMPPEGKPLSAEQIELLKAWIAAGAPWQQAWAFSPLKKPDVPQVQAKQWVRNPIDAFILAQLEARQLPPPQPADKLALLRRATHDLTGLPPTPAEVTAFVADTSPQAYEKLIDRLLASPHYGERWGRHWLDVVRYAETNSFERDGAKPHVFRYRDYVVRAFNDDKPYDQFIREQLAGDELAPATNDSIIATGFYRLGLWDDEPADRELARFDELDDIVATTGQALLGLTVNCARCHDHKIDPIPQRDYYQLLAFFQNVRPMTGHGPNVETPIFAGAESEASFRATTAELEKERNAVQAEITKLEAAAAERYRQVQSAAIDSLRTVDIDNLEYRYYRDSWERLPNFANLKPETTGTVKSGLFDISLSTRTTAFGFVFQGVLIVPTAGKYTFFLDSDDGARLKVNDQVVLDYDGIHGEGSEQQAAIDLPQGRLPIVLEYFQNVARQGLNVAWSGPGLGSGRRSLSKPAEAANTRSIAALIETEGAKIVPPDELVRYKKLRHELAELGGKKAPADVALSVTEFGRQVADTHIMLRGNAHNPGEKVEPAFPSVLTDAKPTIPTPAPDAKTSGRRLALAQWLTSSDNRLTSRVMANRIWQHHFGRGIVRSPNNFGGLGIPPTHPELLDWLATEFVAGSWSMKALHRTIMLSSTYQMSSRPTAAALEVDPANDLFSRFDMLRLSAEEVRDSILAVNGKLNPKMYGPSFYSEISAEVLAGQSVPGAGWGKSPPEEQARRSIYIHVKRSLITPVLASFDFPETDSSCEARFVTTQPTQALGMLNGKFLHDESAALAVRLSKEAGDDSAKRIALALQLALCRPAQPAEIERGLKLIESLQTEHKLSAEAAWNYYCLTVLNLNEFMYLD